jgi:hypothetical protein
MNPVADTNIESADMLAKAVIGEQQEQDVASPTTTSIVKSEVEKDQKQQANLTKREKRDQEELNMALKIANTLRSKLQFKVIAVKPDSYFETAHHAIVGSSWISRPINEAMDQIGQMLCASFGGIVAAAPANVSTNANVTMPATA